MNVTFTPQKLANKKYIQINGRRSSNRRKNSEQPQIFQDLTQKIDTMLKKDYIQWSNQHQNFDITKSQTANNTNLLRKYIKCLYAKYKIADPLDPKKSKKSDKKNQNMFQVKEIQKEQFKTPQRQPQKIDQIFEKEKYITNSVQSSKPCFRQLHHSRANTSYTARETNRLNQSLDRQYQFTNNKSSDPTVSVRIQQSGTTNFHFSHSQLVKQSYRYCIGCQNAILQHNIELHQKSCSLYQQILNKTFQEILSVVENKIIQISLRMENNKIKLQIKDVQDLKKVSQSLLNESRRCISLGKRSRIEEKFKKDYNKSIVIGKKWCESLEDISKLNWFMKMREQLSKQLFQK